MRKMQDVPLDPTDSQRPTITHCVAPSFGHAMALFQSLGHKPGCPATDSSPAGPCICILHIDTDTPDYQPVWKWM